MKVLTKIKSEFGRIKDISRLHLILAAAAALLMTVIAVIQPPLDMMTVSPVCRVITAAEPFVALFIFYALIRRPERSVFRSLGYIYCVGAPFLPIMLTGVFLDPAKSAYYSDNFFNRFLPVWAALWWVGCALLYALMRVLGHFARKGFEEGRLPARVAYALAVMYTPQKTLSREKRGSRDKWFYITVCAVFVALAVFIATVTWFLHTVYSNMHFESILFTMRFAAGGLAWEDILAGTGLTVAFALITGYLCYHMFKCFSNDRLVVADTNSSGEYTLVMNGRKRAVTIALSAAMLCGSAALFSDQTKFVHYIGMKLDKSTIYDNYYVRADESIVTFPEKKRNLIYIYVESMENTYASKDVGGSQDKNYIAGLTELAQENLNFSNTDKLGGASVFVPSITNTMGSTVAQTCGISLNTKIFPLINSIKEFPDTPRLEDILHDNGYNQLYIEGSKGEFSMYDKYVGRYDDCEVFDRKTAADKGYIEEGADYMWKWGIEDQKLIEITKELITDISKKDKPFFVTMYTMDTHTFESGHRCRYCDESIPNDYLASVECSSRQVTGLVNWIKEQPFYEDTTVILVGDHLGNEKTSMVDIDESYVRTTYNCFINPAKGPVNAKGRVFSSLDMFPTTLSAIGAEIKGGRLGLGTDLFSDTGTLCEELGEEEYMTQLERSSDYYDKEFY
ncbi:MAG: LTA synthase family protein [Ruminococcus sp.]|nr:LTA synthase family protein [Ruminococcus sp.]